MCSRSDRVHNFTFSIFLMQNKHAQQAEEDSTEIKKTSNLNYGNGCCRKLHYRDRKLRLMVSQVCIDFFHKYAKTRDTSWKTNLINHLQ